MRCLLIDHSWSYGHHDLERPLRLAVHSRQSTGPSLAAQPCVAANNEQAKPLGRATLAVGKTRTHTALVPSFSVRREGPQAVLLIAFRAGVNNGRAAPTISPRTQTQPELSSKVARSRASRRCSVDRGGPSPSPATMNSTWQRRPSLPSRLLGTLTHIYSDGGRTVLGMVVLERDLAQMHVRVGPEGGGEVRIEWLVPSLVNQHCARRS